ncbi:hypothetical protein ACIPC1_13295 [Streptomyces sp. NPDC087263]|uniref:hypothetical protein n=1 Tax=Streptomyces sp. NPDC087263 TaxID=3365773 RepID=UPI0037FF5365
MQGEETQDPAHARRPSPAPGPPEGRDSDERRAADEQLLKYLARDGFEGRDYEYFQNELVRYALSVLGAWLHSGYIFHLVARQGLALGPTEAELEELRRDSDLREELAGITVARALPRFRQKELVEGGWSYDGGASVTTYFMGACLRAFPNEFRGHRAGEERYRRAAQRQQTVGVPQLAAPSAEDEAISLQRVLDHLKGIRNPRTRTAVGAIVLAGYTHAEIQELFDAPSVRVVEGILHRWRKTTRRTEGDWRNG